MNKLSMSIFKALFCALFLWCIIVPNIHAYNIDDIEEYFAFEDSGLDNATSEVNLFTNSNTLYQVNTTGFSHYTGMSGNGLRATPFVAITSKYTQNLSNGFDISFLNQYSINFWIYNATRTGTEKYFSIHNGTAGFELLNTGSDTVTLRNATGGSSANNKITSYVGDTWFMLTITYNGTNLNFYINGTLQNTTIGQNFYPHSKNLSLSGIGYYILDEFSVWSSVLSNLDILTLYNSGSGLSYSNTLSNNIIPNPVCIDSSSICIVPVYIGGQLVCAYANTTYCGNGCINDICYNTVPNECNVIGGKQCHDSTTIETCSDSNGDTSLDYGSLSNCGVGELCVQSFNFASCNNVTSSGVHNVYAWVFLPYSTSNTSDGGLYTIDTTARKLNIVTNNSLHIQKFYDGTGVNYISRVCDYKETLVYENLLVLTTNSSYPFLFTSPISSKSVLRFSVTPDLLSNGTIIVSDLAGTQDTTFGYKRNATNKQMTIYLSNGSILYDDYDVSASDTLTSIDFEITYDFSSDFYSTRMKFNRNTPNTVIKDILVIGGSDLFNISFLPLTNNITIHYVQLYTIPVASVWTGTLQPITFLESCPYSTNGIFKVRTYGSDYAVPDYESYLDYTLSINLVNNAGTTGVTTSGFVLGQNVTKEMKYVIVLIAIMTIMVVGIGIGFVANFVAGSVVISGVLSAFVLIIFVVGKWIPAWTIAVLVVVGVAVSVIMGFLGSSNSGGNG